jgi:hypothetical protein
MASLKDRCKVEEQLGPAPDDAIPCTAPAVDCPNCGQPNTCHRHLERASDGRQVCFECAGEYELLIAAVRAKKPPKSEERSKRRIASSM